MATRKKTDTEQIESSEQNVDNVQEERREKKETFVAKDIDLTQFITVRNGFQGKLIYVSPRTKEKYEWDSFGDEQEMELRELRNAKSAAKKFFINNWFMFDDEFAWVINYLGMKQYYKNAIPVESFDEFFEKSPAELEKCIKNLSKGQRKSLAYRAREMVASGDIDSRKTIKALEEALGVELIVE